MSIDITINEQNVSVFDGGQKYYLSALSTQDQTNAGATSVNKMTYNTIDISSGISIVSSSRITISKAGIYNIAFSAQLDKSDSGDDIIEIWLCKNGSNVSNSSTEMTLVGNAGKHVAAWNWLVSADANDYFEICWHSTDTQLFINAVTGGTNPTRPAIPSVILTVWQI